MSTDLININLEIDQKEIDYNTKQLIVFKQGGEEYGLEIGQVKEVVLTPYITHIPHAPKFVKGVANIRGSIISIIDLESKFNVNAVGNIEHKSSYTLVIESDDFKIGILVKEVPNTLAVAESDISNTTNIVEDNTEGSYIQGIVKKDNRLIILLDIQSIMTSNN